jgi:hypothetical protein
MTTYIANQNASIGSTWGLTETGTSALALLRNNTTNVAISGTATTPTFTFTNAHVCDGILLWVQQSVAGQTGTFKVDLQKGGVSQATCTVNASDLPQIYNAVATGSPMFFKLGSTVTGDGGTNWTVVITNNTSAIVYYMRNSATAGDLTKALRLTSTGTPVAGDDLYIMGEYTAAATFTARTTTMDGTSAIQYGNGNVNSASTNGGGIRISKGGTLTYGTSASTNYYLQCKGDIEVFEAGTLNIGVAGGSEIPRTSTAVLEFVMNSAAGDFGLQIHSGGTFSSAGLSRTSGKNVVKCKLTADINQNNLFSGGSTSNSSQAINTQLDAYTSPIANGFTDNATASVTHYFTWPSSGGAVTNTTQTFSVYLARGSGTNNRFVRMEVGDNATLGSIANGFFTDIDLQAGTASGPSAVGTGTATSVSITPVGNGYIVRLVGKVASSSQTPHMFLISASGLGTITYTGNTTQCFIFGNNNFVTGTMTDTTFNVDTDTGWLSGDAIAVAATGHAAPQDCQDYLLNATAGASSMTSAMGTFGGTQTSGTFASSYSGTSPFVAEVGLLSRNVKIRSNSSASTGVGYCWFDSKAVCTVQWTEFYWLSSSASTPNKRGCIEIKDSWDNAAGAKSITFCSFHDTISSNALHMFATNGVSFNTTFSNNIIYNTATNSILISANCAMGDYTFDNNLVLKPAQYGFNLADVQGTITNNTVVGVGGATAGFGLFAATNAYGNILGTFSGNTAHSNNSYGININTSGLSGTILNFTAWRCGSYGVYYNGAAYSSDLVISNPTLYGNGNTTSNPNVAITGTTDYVNIHGGAISGDTVTATYAGVFVDGNCNAMLNIDNVDFSGTGTGLAGHMTSDILVFQTAPVCFMGTVNNCKFGVMPYQWVKPTSFSQSSFIGFERFNQTAGNHFTEMYAGQLKIDTTIFHGASPSQRLTPLYHNKKLESATSSAAWGAKGRGMMVPCASGSTVNVSVWVRTNSAGDQVTTFNPYDIACSSGILPSNLALSNGNLTATCNASSPMGVRSTSTRSGGGKYYAEFTAGATYAGGDTGVGIAIAQSLLGGVFANSATLGCLVYASGSIWFNGTNNPINVNGVGGTTRSLGAIAAGNVICIALDLDNKAIWFRKGSGNWNGDASANPATNTNGIDISTLFPYNINQSQTTAPWNPAFLAATFNSSGSSVTMNTGATAFNQTAPSGFSNWDAAYNGDQPRLIQRANPSLGQTTDVVLATSAGSTGTWTQLSGTSSSATDDGVWEFIVDCAAKCGVVNVDDWATT